MVFEQIAFLQPVVPYLIVFLFLGLGLAGWKALKLYRKAQTEYRSSKIIIESLIESFHGRFRAQSARLEAAITQAEEASRKSEALEELIHAEAGQMESLTRALQENMMAQVKFSEALQRLFTKILALEKAHQLLKSQVSALDGRYRGLLPEQEKGVTMTAEGEVLLSRLTVTELQILKLIVEGAKPASEIRSALGKTREHTARLMKKLYLEGYVERDTTALPFRYKLSSRLQPLAEEIKNKDLTFRSLR